MPTKIENQSQDSASAERLPDIFEDAPFAIYEIDFKTPKLKNVNKIMCTITGYTKEELLSMNPAYLLDAESALRFGERREQGLAGQNIDTSVEYKMKAKDGHIIWALVNIKPIYKDGKLDSGLVVAFDITERKKAEEVLFQSEVLKAKSSYARSLIEVSLDPMVTINANGKITDVNKATELVTGYSREQLIGQDFCNYFTEPKKAEQGYQEVFIKGYVKDYPLAILHRTGKTTEVLYNATIYRDSHGVIQGVFAAARDITERKKMEQKLKDTERLAAIGATAGMVGHDIRNPLQAIVCDIYLLNDLLVNLTEGALKKEARESLESIGQNISYINKIVADLQDYARTINPERNLCNLYDAVTTVFQTIVVPENITLSIDIDPTFTFTTDSTLLRRIISNLVINAIQAMPNGGKLDISGCPHQSNVLIIIKDTGVGIPENIKPKIFTPMITTKSKGQGLGLAVVKRLVETLNGGVNFESQEGKGTKFIIKLPLTQI